MPRRTVCRGLACVLFALGCARMLHAFADGPATGKPPVTAVAFAPDGQRVVLAGEGALEVHAWPASKDALESGKPAERLEVKMSHVADVAFHPGGDRVAVAGGSPAEEGVCEILAWPGGRLLERRTLGDDLAMCVAWAADGRLAVGLADGRVRVLSPDSAQQEPRTLAGHARAVTAVAFLPGGRKLVSAGLDQSLRVWDLDTGAVERTLSNHTGAVAALAVRPTRPDAQTAPPLVATIGRDRTLRLWQPTLGRLVRFARLPAEPVALAWSSDGSAVAAGCVDGQVRRIDPDTAEISRTLPAIEGWIYALAPIPGEEAFLAAGEAGRAVRVAP